MRPEGATTARTDAAPPPPTLPTRFGPVALDEDRLITFDDGLLGFAGRRRYLLADPPRLGQGGPFRLLQAADDGEELAFLVLPLDAERGPVARDDLRAACDGLGIAFADLAVLAIVTARRGGDGRVGFTVNLRAPLLLDAARRRGRQHVLSDPRYGLRHPLPPPADAAGAEGA